MDFPTWLARPWCFMEAAWAAYPMQMLLIVKRPDRLQEHAKCCIFPSWSMMRGQRQRQTDVMWTRYWEKAWSSDAGFSRMSLPCPTAVGVSLFSGASDLIAVFVHTPTLAGAAMTLGWFKVAFVGASRKVGAWGKTRTHPSSKWSSHSVPVYSQLSQH